MKIANCVKLTLCVLPVLAMAPAWARQIGGVPQPFSADFSVTTHNGQKIAGKWYFAPPKIRIDVTSMSQRTGNGPFGGNISMIIDSSTQTTDMLMPQMQMYMEMHGTSGRMDPAMRNLQNLGAGACPQNATCTKVGSEVVNGRSCDKYEVTDKSGKSTLWIDQKLNFPIRAQSAEGSMTEFTNIKEAAPDASLFKVPPGYRQFDPSAFAGHKGPN